MRIWHFEEVWRYREALAYGLGNTLMLNFAVILLGTLAGLFVAWFRLSNSKILRFVGHLYVDLFRTLPLLVLLVWLFFALPLFPGIELRLGSFQAAILALSLNLSAFVAEIIRAGLQDVPSYYIQTAEVAGFSKWQTWRYITAPIAFRLMLAPLWGQYINQVKLSVLASVIAVPELLHTVNTITTETFRPLELYTVLAGIFLAVLLPCTWLQSYIERRLVRSLEPANRQSSNGHIALGQGEDAAYLSTLPLTRTGPSLRAAQLRVAKVAVAYNGVTILRDVTFTACSGTITGIIGANGGGKTTLLRVLAGLIPLKAGSVVIEMNGTRYKDIRRGYMTQEHQPWPHLSVRDNVALPLRLVAKHSREESERLALEWLRAFGLESRANSRPSELSGGQRQRLTLAVTLCLNPRILFLDEPTSAMDFRWALKIADILRRLAADGALVICVSHALGFIRNTADNLLFLDDAALAEAGPTQSMLASPQTGALRTFLEAT